MSNQTVTYADPSAGPIRKFVAPYLIRCVQCLTPNELPARYSIAEVDKVELGRGDSHTLLRTTVAGQPTLRLTIKDIWMSSQHATLVKSGAQWSLSDAGSKNGTFYNGENISKKTSVYLHDGDTFAVGGTFFLFRNTVERDFRSPADIELTQLEDTGGFQTLHPEYAEQLAALASVAQSTIPVLLRGETGTGKEVTARSLHTMSGRKGNWVAVNCGALPASLIESELFGHTKGAFSGAIDNQLGYVRAANGGTLFLDEIGEMPIDAQVKLLRVLQEKEVVPVGSDTPIPVDIRIIAASHKDLRKRVPTGQFRADLLARLAGYEFHLAPLEERREDLGLLIAALLEKHNLQATRFDRPAVLRLLAYPWPYNIRQLEQVLCSSAALAGTEPISVVNIEQTGILPEVAIKDDSGVMPSSDTYPPVTNPLRQQLIECLTKHQGNISAVARDMGKARVQIRRWCKKFDLDIARYK